jgi:hypothetical protein
MIKVTIKNKIYQFDNFKDYLQFYQQNIHKTTKNFTHFINNAESENDIFEIKDDNNVDIKINGATQMLANLIKQNLPNNAIITDKIDGWNPGCAYKIDNKEYFCKVLSGDVDGNYSWASEIFAYKLMENLGIGPKCSFKTIGGAEPLTMITTESVYNNAKKTADFPLAFNNLKDIKNLGIADLMMHIALIDDIYYNYHNVASVDNKAVVFDVLAPPFDENFDPITQNDYNEKLNYFDSYRNECSSSGSLINENQRDLGYLVAVRELQTKEFKGKFDKAIKDAFNFTKKYITELESRCITTQRKDIFKNLYNLEALEKYKDVICDRFNKIDKLGKNTIEEGEPKITEKRLNKYEYGDKECEVVKNWTIPFSKVSQQYKDLKTRKIIEKWKNYKRNSDNKSL